MARTHDTDDISPLTHLLGEHFISGSECGPLCGEDIGRSRPHHVRDRFQLAGTRAGKESQQRAIPCDAPEVRYIRQQSAHKSRFAECRSGFEIE